MCGRFAFYSPTEATAALFTTADDLDLAPRYNIAPTQNIAAVRKDNDGARGLVALRWGLVPSWAKDRAIGNRMINARAETLTEKPSFRAAFRQRRCLVLADGYYEWRSEGGRKQPYYFSAVSGEPFAFAGLWECWTDKQTGELLQTATIVTTEANVFVSKLHHRMPVIVSPDVADLWLDIKGDDDNELFARLEKSSPELAVWPVDRRVNNARNEGAELIVST